MGIVSKIREALKRAQGDVDALQAKVGYWQNIVDAKRAELAELNAGVGKRVADDDTGTALQEYAGARYGLSAQIEGARGALEEFERRLQTATWALKSAQAAERREQATAVRAEAEKRQAKLDELVAELEGYEGGRWVEWQPSREDMIQAGAAGIRVSPRKTPAMFADAARLEAEATQLEEYVATARRQAAVIVPHARIVWPGQHYKGALVNLAVEADVNDGAGAPVRFEVLKNGQVVHTAVLPDGGRRGFRKLVDAFHGDTIEVRADGRVLVSETPKAPDGEVNIHRGPIVAGYTT